MDIGLGMHVYTSDGQDVGAIDRLILDPDTNQVKAAVIRKGVFLSRDREVSRDRMDITPGGPIRLSSSAKEVNTLPEFDPVAYTTPPPDYPLPAGYPSERMYLPFGYGRGASRSVTDRGVMAGNAVSREVGAAWRQQDLANAVIQEGSTVFSREGDKVGDVHQLTFDQQTSALTRIVVRKGFIFTKDTELPASMIGSVRDGAVTLSVSADEVTGALTPLASSRPLKS